VNRFRFLAALVLLAASSPHGPAQEKSPPAAFADELFRFDPFVFSGDQFPPGAFVRPEIVERLIGHHQTKITFLDAAGRPVAAPTKDAGRYAAIVEIAHGDRISKRFFTLYHVAGNGREKAAATGATLSLPRGAGVDPDLLPGQADDVDRLTTKAIVEAMRHDPAGAALLAGLHDLALDRKAGNAKLEDRAGDRERQWWVDFRRRHYGFDKLHPEPFVCPRSLEGKPAPVVRTGTLADAGMKPDAIETIDAACKAWIKENPAGFAICVVRRGIVVFHKAYGESNGKAVTTETSAILASLTKFLNAILLLEFIDQGLINLDDPVAKHVPALRGIRVSRSMTIRDLYMHTCGFTSSDGDTWPDLEEVVADMVPTLEVGVKHQYQGMGLSLASKIMENKSGEALPYLYRNHLFAPLGCDRTRADLSSFGSTGITMDLAKIGQMMLNGGAYGDKRFFSAKTHAQMLPIPGKDRIGPDKTVRWGIGIKQFDSDNLSDEAYGHAGAGGPFIVVDPTRELVIAHIRHSEGSAFKTFLEQKGRVISAITAAIKGDETP
jgi:CubicO group peptidase (beta-lactamase class C family)